VTARVATARTARRFALPWRLIAGAGLLAVLALLLLLGPAAWIVLDTEGLRYDAPNAVPVSDAAIVFGAGLLPDGSPSPLLADRVHAAVLLYRAGRVKRLILSGDGVSPGHDEPAAMTRLAEAEGVPAAAIVRDPEGLHTYDTCSRAWSVYGVRTAVAVSQSYHLPRAIYTCRALGISTTGFSFARVAYGGSPAVRAREVVSLDLAWWQMLLDHK
jgi:vancomycin permeability regulator SanA